MKTYPLLNEEGKLYAFEVGNLMLSRRRATKIVEEIPGSTVIRRPKWFSFSNQDIFCEFILNKVHFLIEEPYGDNSRYFIGKKESGWCPELEVVMKTFNNAGWFK